MQKTYLVTGGAGFIGSAVVRHLMNKTGHKVVNVDKLTYSGHTESLESVASNERYSFEKADICDQKAIEKIFAKHKPSYVMHLAAESHVDNSIAGPRVFVETNVLGTHVMLESARAYWNNLEESAKKSFRFLHISTDEVFGELGNTGYFTETTPYSPRSPYSASKASSDHLVRAWHHTYGLPTLVTNCSNNYGPFQFPEKLIPVIIASALAGKPIPIYGKGENIRDWLFVDDHVTALLLAVEKGVVGDTYAVGGRAECNNLDMAKTICRILDELVPRKEGKYGELITFVTDRAGHDWRYAIDSSKIERELGWKRSETFQSGIRKTVEWYLENQAWCRAVVANSKTRK